MTFTKQMLSGSVNGKQIKITATTSGSANNIHTAVAGSGSFDEIWLYAYNDFTGSVTLNLNWGGTTEPDNKITVTVPSLSGRTLVCDGMLLNNGLTVKAYAATANEIMIDGFV